MHTIMILGGSKLCNWNLGDQNCTIVTHERPKSSNWNPSDINHIIVVYGD